MDGLDIMREEEVIGREAVEAVLHPEQTAAIPMQMNASNLPLREQMQNCRARHSRIGPAQVRR